MILQRLSENRARTTTSEEGAGKYVRVATPFLAKQAPLACTNLLATTISAAARL